MRAWLLAALALSLSCRTVAANPLEVLRALEAKPGSHLKGPARDLGAPRVLNAEDFVYDARLSLDAKKLAVARLGLKGYALSLFELVSAPPKKLADVPINTYEFDVEMTELSPDGTLAATVSRDGAVRLFDATSGAVRGAWLTDEPLVSLAVAPGGKYLAVGSAQGLVTVLSLPDLHFITEMRAHTDEVRGLAFIGDGTLVTAGWDKRLVHWSVSDAANASQVRTRVEKKNGLMTFRAVVDQRVSANATIDTRFPLTVMQGALAQAAGIDVAGLTETTTLVTGFGNQIAKVAKAHTLTFKGLNFANLDIAVCDACVPTGTELVLGAAAAERFDFGTDDATHELVITVKPGALDVRNMATLELTRGAVVTFDAFINDLTVDAQGTTFGVAFSAVKAQRTREVYEREKRGELPPANDWDCGARVEVSSGKVLEKFGVARSGVVATAAISPDGESLATGDWSKDVHLFSRAIPAPISRHFGAAVRRVRFSRDGRWLSVAAWTPQNPLGNHQSDPAAVVYEVVYGADASTEP